MNRLDGLEGVRRRAWLAIAAIITGMGIWATHFVAMLAFMPRPPAPRLHAGYDLGLTVLSLAAAIGLIGASFEILLRAKDRLRAAMAGGVVGIAIGAMHYIGMAAFRVEGRLIWDVPLIVQSVLTGVVLSAAAFAVRRGDTPWRKAAPGLLLVLAICGLHFTGMSAVSILPDPSIQLPPRSLPNGWLAIWVGSGALLLLVLSVGALVVEDRGRRAEALRLRQLADASVEGLVICRAGEIVLVNKSFESLSGVAGAQLVGSRFDALFEGPADPSKIPAEGVGATLRTASGERLPVELTVRPIVYEGAHTQGIGVRDLRDRVAAEAHIRFLAHHDPLTRLPNRLCFNEALEAALQTHRRQGDAFAVLCLDLDRFKQINDIFGHGAGDAVLRVTSQRIASVLATEDLLARLGGDEFAIIRLGPSAPEELDRLSDAIIAAATPEILFEGIATMVGVSIGVASYPHDGDTAAKLMRNADAALYQAKSQGRGRHRRFDATMGEQLRERETLEFELRNALARNELSVVYQPQVRLNGGEVFGFEALVRWTSPTRGVVPPSVFVPLAEETGQILTIGEWVLKEACRTAAGWESPLQIAVNLSGVQLRSPTLAASIQQILEETGLPADRLELEVTETALVADFHLALHTLRRLKALGVHIAMDDFGTGYSSLANLRSFPFDKIKIDRSFIQNVHCSEEAATIVRAIVGLARGLNLEVLAEGVESAEELAFLRDELCAEAQGYYFGRPGDITNFKGTTDPAASVPPAAESASESGSPVRAARRPARRAGALRG